MRKYLKYFILLIVFIIIIVPRETYAASVSTYGIEYCVTNNIGTPCNTGTNGSFTYNYNNNRVNHISFVTFNTNHDINISAGDTVTMSALFWVTNDSINNLTEVYDLGPQLYGATANDFDIISIEPVDMTNTLFWSQNSQLDYYDISYQHLYIIRLQAKNNITREYWRLRWDIDLSYSTTASGTYRFRVNVSTGSPSNDYLILQAIQGISSNQSQTTDAINNMNSNITNSSTEGNNMSGTTSQIESMIPQDEKSQGFYNNIFTFYNRVNDSIDTTCSNYTLSLMNQTIVFPCINMANIFGDWWSIIDLLCCIWPLLNIFNLIIGWVDGITDLEDLSYFKSAKHIHWSREDYRKGLYY